MATTSRFAVVEKEPAVGEKMHAYLLIPEGKNLKTKEVTTTSAKAVKLVDGTTDTYVVNTSNSVYIVKLNK